MATVATAGDFTPLKPTERFRVYEENPQDEIQKRVHALYHAQHRNQTVQFVNEKVRCVN